MNRHKRSLQSCRAGAGGFDDGSSGHPGSNAPSVHAVPRWRCPASGARCQGALHGVPIRVLLYLARLLLLFVTCLGLVGVPLQVDESCWGPEASSAQVAPTDTHDASGGLSAQREADDEGSCTARDCCQAGDCSAGCVSGCACCHPLGLALSWSLTTPVTTVTDRFSVAPARRPANRDPDGLLQVPKAA